MNHSHHSDSLDQKSLFSDFEQNGFVCINDALSLDMINHALVGVHDLLKGLYDTGQKPLFEDSVNNNQQNNRVGQAHWANSAIMKLAQSPVIGKAISAVSRSDSARLWGSQLYFKPARQRSLFQVGFHRDSQHLPCFERGCYTVWIPLMDVTTDNGAIIYIKNSHRSDQITPGLGAEIPNVHSMIKDDFCDNHFIVQMKAGGFCIHHQDLIHGSMNNITDSERPALALSILTDDYVYNASKDDYEIHRLINNPELTYKY